MATLTEDVQFGARQQFVQEVVDRWWELRQPGRPFEQAVLMALADQMGQQIGNTAGGRDAAPRVNGDEGLRRALDGGDVLVDGGPDTWLMRECM